MKGLYVARLDLNQAHLAGVARKIEAQMGALAKAGAPTELLCLRDGAIVLADKTLASAGDGWSRRRNHHFAFHDQIVAAAASADFVFIRYQGAPPAFLSALARLKKRRPELPVVLEIPSWPFATERRGLRAQLLGAFEDVGNPRLRRYVDQVVTFSQAEEIFVIPTLRTDNGVDVETIPLAASPPPPDGLLRVTGVANLSFWHGYDRVIEGLANYGAAGGRRPVRFEIVGSGAEEPQLRQQVERSGLAGIVDFLGPLHGAELDRHMAGCHVGISSIGMHRLDVDTSNIKSREFCARGLPFVIGYPDRDFPRTLPFVLHIPADESPLDIEALIRWYDTLRTEKPDPAPQMRAYAEANLTWHAKFKPVVDWLHTRIGETAS